MFMTPVKKYPSPNPNLTDEQWTTVVNEIAKKFDVHPPDAYDPKSGLPPLSDTYVRDFFGIDPKSTSFGVLQSLSSQIDLSKVSDAGFVPQHVEPLMKQAGRLIDRALATDREFFRLSVEFFNILLELCQFFALNNVTQAEVNAGVNELPFLDADADLTMLDNSRSANSDLKTCFDQVTKFVGDDVFAVLQNSTYDTVLFNLRAMVGKVAEADAGTGSHLIPGAVGVSYQDLLCGAAVMNVMKTFPLNQALSRAQARKQTLQSDNDDARKLSVQRKQAYYDQDKKVFKVERRAVAVGIMQLKYWAMADPSGVLSYAERLRALKGRQQADLAAAYARMLAISKGLQTVYNFSSVGPCPPASPVNLDLFVNWLRAVDNAIVESARLDQQYVCRISVSAVLGDVAFKAGLASGLWQFPLPSTPRFDGQCLCRVRGVAVFAIDRNGQAFYDANVTAPASGEYIYSSTNSLTIEQGNKQNISPCFLRGIGSRQNVRPPEITGQSALWNCSPLSGVRGAGNPNWTVQLIGNSVKDANANGLTDLQLDIYLASQMV
jgi:hypothetical protein